MPSKQFDRVTKTRTRMLLDAPWFGLLSLHLKIVEDNHMPMPTMATDGTTLFFDSEWVSKLTDNELMFTFCHEIMHAALTHPFRIKGKIPLKANVAADLAINPLLRKQGLTMPDGMLDDPKYYDMSFEQIYSLLPDDPSNLYGQGKGGGKGQTIVLVAPGDGNTQSTTGMSKTDWEVAVEQATSMMQQAGTMSSDMERLIKEARESKTDWRTILRRFVEQTVPSNYSWATPNRRYVSQGVYLPGVCKENCPKIGIGVDTSGSISLQLLSVFAKELSAIMHEVQPEEICVVYCDASVTAVESFTPDDGEVILHAKGGGGTAFGPVFEYFKDNPPALVIYSTDMDNSDKDVQEPDQYPVLWIAPISCQNKKPPFGEIVFIEED